MNREDIIRMAREAGFHAWNEEWNAAFDHKEWHVAYGEWRMAFERLAIAAFEAGAAAEQNKQTKIANDMESALEAFVRYCYARDLGYIDEVTEAETALDAAIRARGEK